MICWSWRTGNLRQPHLRGRVGCSASRRGHPSAGLRLWSWIRPRSAAAGPHLISTRTASRLPAVGWKRHLWPDEHAACGSSLSYPQQRLPPSRNLKDTNPTAKRCQLRHPTSDRLIVMRTFSQVRTTTCAELRVRLLSRNRCSIMCVESMCVVSVCPLTMCTCSICKGMVNYVSLSISDPRPAAAGRAPRRPGVLSRALY